MFRKKNTNHTRQPRVTTSTQKVSSYYTPKTSRSSRDDTVEKRERYGRLSRGIKRFGLVALVGVLAISLVRLRSDPVVVVATETTTNRLSSYEDTISQLIASSVLNTNKITLQSGRLEQQIQERFPEVEQVDVVSSVIGNRPTVHLKVQDIAFIVESGGKSYAISDNGIVAGELSEFSSANKATRIRDESGIEIKKGERIMRSDDAQFFRQANELITLKGAGKVSAIRITSVPREAFIVLEGVPYQIRVFLEEPVEEQMGSYFSALKILGEGGVAPSSYIDVRAGEKVFWQ